MHARIESLEPDTETITTTYEIYIYTHIFVLWNLKGRWNYLLLFSICPVFLSTRTILFWRSMWYIWSATWSVYPMSAEAELTSLVGEEEAWLGWLWSGELSHLWWSGCFHLEKDRVAIATPMGVGVKTHGPRIHQSPANKREWRSPSILESNSVCSLLKKDLVKDVFALVMWSRNWKVAWKNKEPQRNS